jgi:hypothetical protein
VFNILLPICQFLILFIHLFIHYIIFIIRLIVVAEKKVVYEKFPIPLINRLEKHFLAMDTMLSDTQRRLAEHLHHWAQDFCHTGLARTHSPRGARYEWTCAILRLHLEKK